MEELIKRLNEIPNSYFDFVAGVVTYVKQKPKRLKNVMEFLDESKDITPSDVVKFIMQQPDFHEYSSGT